MSVAFSSDGLHWSQPQQCPEIDAAGDTHNNALWVPELDKYVAITRLWNRKLHIRQVGWTSSKDFLTWSKAKVILEGTASHLQVYSMPVFRYAGVYIGLPVIFNSKTDRSHTELAWSPNTITWHRICLGTPLIANSEKKGDYDWGCVYAAAYPIFQKKEIRLYYGGSNGPHTDWRDGFFCLATLRPDGFAGYEPIKETKPAIIVTKDIICRTKLLQVTADIKEGGYVRVSIINEQGNKLADTLPIKKTVTDAEVTWKKDIDFSSLLGKDIRLKFIFMKAKLYSFSFKH